MYIKKIYSAFAWIAIFVTVAFSVSITPVRAETLILFDASQSMLDKFDGQTRLAAAKEAVYDFVGSIGDKIELGLRLYAHKNHAGNQAVACKETQLVQPFTTNHGSIISKVAGVEAVGSYTPTAYALSQTQNDFTVGEDNVLILLTDGKETCDGDPVTVAKRLCEAGIQVKTYVIGLGVDTDTRTELTNIATAGCGKYYDATDSDSLAASFAAISAVVDVPIDRSRDIVGGPVRGGSQVSNAVELTDGTYHLDHHQKESEYDYFYISMKPGEKYYIEAGLSEYEITYDATTNTFIGEKENRKSGIEADPSSEIDVVLLQTENGTESQIEIAESNSYQQRTEYFIVTYNSDKSITIETDYSISRGYDGRRVVAHPLVGNFDRLYFKVGNDISEMHKLAPFTIKKMDNVTGSSNPSGEESSSIESIANINDGTNSTNPMSVSLSPMVLIVAVSVILLLFLGALYFALRKKPQPTIVEQSPIMAQQTSTPTDPNIPPQQ